jgi:hypothetical protein
MEQAGVGREAGCLMEQAGVGKQTVEWSRLR